MIENIPIPYDLEPGLYVAVGLAVASLALARIYSDERLFGATAVFWTPLRLVALPTLDKVLATLPIPAKTTVREREIVTEGLDLTLENLRDDLADAGYEKQPLASIGRLETTGDLERGSFARYLGDKPFGAEQLPNWLRKYQVHVRPFGEDGDLTLTAHHEYNPWHPLYALPHALGYGLDAEKGVKLAAEDLGIEDLVAA